jgi:hypothetical protein
MQTPIWERTMDSRLVTLCREFEQIGNFLTHKSTEDTARVDQLFDAFIDTFADLKEEKLDYPREFQTDVKLYHEGYEPLIQKFEDREIRYLMLSDFYDFVTLTKKYRR